MPASRIKLGHNQKLYVDGVVAEGTRDVTVNVTSKTVDITGLSSKWASTLPVSIDAEVTVTLYYSDDVQKLIQNLYGHPKTPVTLRVPNLFDGKFVVTDIKAAIPMGAVVAHEVTFKVWGWN